MDQIAIKREELHRLNKRLKEISDDIVKETQKLVEIRKESAEEMINFFIKEIPELEKKRDVMLSTIGSLLGGNQEYRNLAKELRENENSEPVVKKFKTLCVDAFENNNEHEIAEYLVTLSSETTIQSVGVVGQCCDKEEPVQKNITQLEENKVDLNSQKETKKQKSTI